MKLGLALSGGVAWGFAHIGVLEIFERERIQPDMVAGTSIGAIIGSLWLMGKTSKEIAGMARELSEERLRLIRPHLSRHSLLSGAQFIKKAKAIYGDMTFADLPEKFACVATDVYSGQAMIINSGLLWQAILATSCIPMIFEPVEIGGHYLVDGGLSNSVPVTVAKKLGASTIIAVNVQPRKHPAREDRKPSMLTVAIGTATIRSARLIEKETEFADVVIEPKTDFATLVNITKHQQLIEAGRQAAVQAIPKIRKLVS